MTTPKPKAEPKPPNPSSYLVMLRDAKGDHVWVELGFYTQPTPRKAIKAAMEARDMAEGDFRAIPKKSTEVHSPRVTSTTTWKVDA